jgi:hypothetical protein
MTSSRMTTSIYIAARIRVNTLNIENLRHIHRLNERCVVLNVQP